MGWATKATTSATPFDYLMLHSIIEDLLSLWGGSRGQGKPSTSSYSLNNKDEMIPSMSLPSVLEPSPYSLNISNNIEPNIEKESLTREASNKKRRSDVISPCDSSQMSPISSASMDPPSRPFHPALSILD